MRALYFTHTGLTQPLGQAQVLPYLVGLARHGADIDIVSFEPPDLSAEARETMQARLARERIGWHPLQRKPTHAFSRKVYEMAWAGSVAARLAVQKRPHIVHGRSYFASAVADAVRRVVPGAKLLFDCRGMLGNEYVDGGHWTEDRLEYRLLKQWERYAFRTSEGMVVLTRALARWLEGQHVLGRRTRLQVVPCCVDMDRFGVDDEDRARVRRELGLQDAFVVVYSGTLGSWYCAKEMAQLFAAIRARVPSARLLLLSRSDTREFEESARALGVDPAHIVKRAVDPSQMAQHLRAGDVGLSLIRPCFSKTGSSPTKVAEYLACGVPVIVNGGIGDQRDLANARETAFVLDDRDGFSASELERAATWAIALREGVRETRSVACTAMARQHFGLHEVGIPRYVDLYEALASR